MTTSVVRTEWSPEEAHRGALDIVAVRDRE